MNFAAISGFLIFAAFLLGEKASLVLPLSSLMALLAFQSSRFFRPPFKWGLLLFLPAEILGVMGQDLLSLGLELIGRVLLAWGLLGTLKSLPKIGDGWKINLAAALGGIAGALLIAFHLPIESLKESLALGVCLGEVLNLSLVIAIWLTTEASPFSPITAPFFYLASGLGFFGLARWTSTVFFKVVAYHLLTTSSSIEGKILKKIRAWRGR